MLKSAPAEELDEWIGILVDGDHDRVGLAQLVDAIAVNWTRRWHPWAARQPSLTTPTHTLASLLGNTPSNDRVVLAAVRLVGGDHVTVNANGGLSGTLGIVESVHMFADLVCGMYRWQRRPLSQTSATNGVWDGLDDGYLADYFMIATGLDSFAEAPRH